MNNTHQIRIGWAQSNITPPHPALMIGQMYQRISEYIHDPITATALVLDNGAEQATFISLDMTEIPMHAFELLRSRLEPYKEIDFDRISFNVTHTHNSTDFNGDFMREESERIYGKDIMPKIDAPDDLMSSADAQAFLVGMLFSLILRAWESREPGGISYAHDYAAVAFNRRPVFNQGGGEQTVMYGDCSQPDFVKFEGGTDTSVELLYTWSSCGELTGVVVNVPCPAQVYELHSFISADYWGPARNEIREKLGKIYILSTCGAAGDLAPIDLVKISKTNRKKLLEWGGQTKEVHRNFDMALECQAIAERISEAVVRGYRYARNYIDYTPAFIHEVLELDLPIRQISGEEYREAEKEVQRIKQKHSKDNPMTMEDLVAAFEPQGVVIRYEQQKKSAVFRFSSHIIRIGGVAFATNPFELYHEYGLRIKACAKAEQVFVVQLSSDVIGGYLPTRDAVNGGSYSSKPASTTCGPDGGDILVERTLDAINRMWA